MRTWSMIPVGLVLLAGVSLWAAERAAAVPQVDDIARLAQRGLGEEVLMAMVQKQEDGFSLSANEIIKLKHAGVSEKVIVAMLRRGPPASAREKPLQREMPRPASGYRETGRGGMNETVARGESSREMYTDGTHSGHASNDNMRRTAENIHTMAYKPDRMADSKPTMAYRSGGVAGGTRTMTSMGYATSAVARPTTYSNGYIVANSGRAATYSGYGTGSIWYGMGYGIYGRGYGGYGGYHMGYGSYGRGYGGYGGYHMGYGGYGMGHYGGYHMGYGGYGRGYGGYGGHHTGYGGYGGCR